MFKKWWVLTGVACGTFMATLDSSIVNIALPTLTREWNEPVSHVKWIVIIYLLLLTLLVLPFGRVSDLYGRKRAFLYGYLTFVTGSGLCGFAPSVGFLIFFRAIQACGGAMLMANGPAVITSAFPPQELGKALGTLAMVVSGGLISGPALGGFVITHLGWRAIFWINVPIGILGMYLVKRFFYKQPTPQIRLPFDSFGAFLQAFFLICFILALDPLGIDFHEYGSYTSQLLRVSLLLLSLIAFILFVIVEKRHEAPLVDFSLLHNRTFWTANLAGFLTFVSFSGLSIFMPFFLENVHKYDTETSGAFMALIPLTILFVAPVTGRLSDQYGSKGLSLLGSGALCISFTLMATHLSSLTSPLWITLLLILIGFGIGAFQSPNNNAIMGRVPKKKLSTASAFLATVRNLGMVTGTSLAAFVFHTSTHSGLDFSSSIRAVLWVSAIMALGAFFASMGKPKGPHWSKHELEKERKGTHRGRSH